MKRTAYISILFILAAGICSCEKEKTCGDANQIAGQEVVSGPQGAPSGVHMDTLLVIAMPDNAIWGHLGEGTGMSVLEFITDSGDTLYINKESEYTGQEGCIQGSIRNYTDRYCITTTDSGQTLVKAVNVTQLQEIWSDAAYSERENKQNK